MTTLQGFGTATKTLSGIVDINADIAQIGNVGISNGSVSGISDISANTVTCTSLTASSITAGSQTFTDQNTTNLTVTNTATFQGDITQTTGKTTLQAITCSSLVSSGSVSGTSLSGTIYTPAQPNITSLGTLSSLTVSGDLTVDSSTLVVNSSTNRVGIARSPSSFPLEVNGSIYLAGNATSIWMQGTSDADPNKLRFHNLNNSGFIDWGAGGTLNFRSGISPSNRLAIPDSGAIVASASMNLTSGNTYQIGGTTVLSNNTLGSGVVASSLTTVGTLINLTVSGNISCSTTPSLPEHVTRKDYVDSGLATKQNTLTFDTSPTTSSTNPVTSGGIKNYVDSGLSIKQNTLTFDTSPTTASINPVTSGGIKTYVDNGLNGKQDQLTGSSSLSVFSITTEELTVDRPAASGGGNLLDLKFNGTTEARFDEAGILYCQDVDCSEVVASTLLDTFNLQVHNDIVLTAPGADILFNSTGNITMSGGSLVGAANVSGTNLSGTLTTSAQPNITSLGTLSSLTTTGACELAKANSGRFVEIKGDSVNTSFIDFHSNDSGVVDFDTRIVSQGGNVSASGGGTLVLRGAVVNLAPTGYVLPRMFTFSVYRGTGSSYTISPGSSPLAGGTLEWEIKDGSTRGWDNALGIYRAPVAGYYAFSFWGRTIDTSAVYGIVPQLYNFTTTARTYLVQNSDRSFWMPTDGASNRRTPMWSSVVYLSATDMGLLISNYSSTQWTEAHLSGNLVSAV